MYAKHWITEVHTAFHLAENHKNLLRRILAWQQVIYSDPQLPGLG
jgi:hypothetical protein